MNGQRIDKASPKELVEGDEITVSSNASLAAKAIHVMCALLLEAAPCISSAGDLIL